MLNFGNKEFRNLQEQVQKNADDIQKFNYGGAVLSEFGIKVVGQVDNADYLPDVDLFTEADVGNAYAVGTETPYELYILTRPFIEGDPLQWFNIGRFPEPGPQGEQGEQGIQGQTGVRGSRVTCGTAMPSTISDAILGDVYLLTTNSSIYSFTGTSWRYEGSFRGETGQVGPMGLRGDTGPQGPVGPQGPKGDQGNSLRILGIVESAQQLPDPGNFENQALFDGAAYLVGTQPPYRMYVMISNGATRYWQDTGNLNQFSIINLNENRQDVDGGTLSTSDLQRLNSGENCILLYRLNGVDHDINYEYYIKCANRYYQNPQDLKNNRYLVFICVDPIPDRQKSEPYYSTTATPNLDYVYIDTQTGAWRKSSKNIITDDGSFVKDGELATTLESYQPLLHSGTNIRYLATKNGHLIDLLGSGNTGMTTADTVISEADIASYATLTQLNNAVEQMVPMNRLKTINGISLLINPTNPEFNIQVVPTWGSISGTLASQTDLKTVLDSKEDAINSTHKISANFISGLATVATSGSYEDLTNKPVIPVISYPVTDVQVGGISVLDGTVAKITLPDASWGNITGSLSNQTDLMNALAAKANSSSLAAVATSGSYDDLTDKPTIPTNTNQLTNGAGFITSTALSGYAQSSDIPTAVSELSNDSDFQTESEVVGLINSSLNGYATTTYVDNAISGLGNVFNIKGSVANVASLPASGNSIGDVYYVASEQAGYVWIEINNVPQWEELGPSIDLSNYALKSELPTATSDLTNDSGFITSSALNGYALTSDIPTNNNQLTNGAGYITSNALSGYVLSSALAAVATSGSYNDLSNKPSLFSGDYNDLTNKPTIPAAVTANPTIPSGTTPTTLSSLQIGNGYYSIASGSGGSSVEVDEKTIITNSQTGEIETATGAWKEVIPGTPGGSPLTGTTALSTNPPASSSDILLVFNTPVAISHDEIVFNINDFSASAILNDGKDTEYTVEFNDYDWSGVSQWDSLFESAGLDTKDIYDNFIHGEIEYGSAYANVIFDGSGENIIAIVIDNNKDFFTTQFSFTVTFTPSGTPAQTVYYPMDAEFVNIQQRSSEMRGGLYILDHTLYCDAVGRSELMQKDYATQSDLQDALDNFSPTNIIYSQTEPQDPVEGMIWLKPLS